MDTTPTPELTTCRCCGKPLRWYWQMSSAYGECRTEGCRRQWITLTLEELAIMSEDYVDRCLAATRRSEGSKAS